jgi:hypothetical protein
MCNKIFDKSYAPAENEQNVTVPTDRMSVISHVSTAVLSRSEDKMSKLEL